MRDIVDVIFGERELIEDFVEDLKGFLLCIGFGGRQRDDKYIRESVGELKSEENLKVVECLYNSLSDVVPHAMSILEAYGEAVSIPRYNSRILPGGRFSEREKAAQEAVQGLLDLDDSEFT